MKSEEVLISAYDDAAGVTARVDLNLLHRTTMTEHCFAMMTGEIIHVENSRKYDGRIAR